MLLDALGALIAGTETPAAKIVAGIAESQFGGSQASILVRGSKTSASGAALANGFAANALDIDDGYRLVKGHPGACVLPVILTAAEFTPAMHRGRILNRPHHRLRTGDPSRGASAMPVTKPTIHREAGEPSPVRPPPVE